MTVSPMRRLAIRRMRNECAKNVLFSFLLFVSSMAASVFFFFEYQLMTKENRTFAGLPCRSFIHDLEASMLIVLVSLLLFATVTVTNHCRVKNRELSQTVSMLRSIGAGRRSIFTLLMTELAILAYVPLFLGSALGAWLGSGLGAEFLGAAAPSWSDTLALVATWLLFFFILLLLTSASYFITARRPRRGSEAARLRRQGEASREVRHGYRNSKTYRSRSLYLRLAEKNISFHRAVYRRIAMTFAVSLLSVALIVMLFVRMGNVDFVVDINPYDNIDTSAAVFAAIDRVLAFFAVSLVFVTVFGILEAVFLLRMHLAERSRAADVYVAIGMPRAETRYMLRVEARSILVRSVSYFVIAVLILIVVFAVVTG